MKRIALALLALMLSACAAQPSLYERIETSIAARSDLATLGQPAPELEQVAWMLGRWEVEATVFATKSAPQSIDHGHSVISRVMGKTWLQMADSYPGGTQDLGFLGYNPVTQQWVSVALDSTGNSVVTTARGWERGQLALLAPEAVIVGEKVNLRQTLTKVSADEFLLLNEEKLGGAWVRLDQYRFRRARSRG